MKDNVINLKTSKIDFPNDLMTFKEVYEKYKIKYCTLYKYTRQLPEIPVFTRGGLKVSEKDVIEWLNKGYNAV